MFRYKLVLAYDGEDFHGWQIQNKGRTVQGSIEDALYKIYQNRVNVTGCGRTDAGVHANNYVAHIDLPGTLEFDLKYKLNRMLGDDIAIKEIAAVSADFHARFSALYRQYRYHLNARKMPIGRQYSWHCADIMSFDKMAIEEGLSHIRNAREFYPFCKTGNDAKTMSCNIHHALWSWDMNGEKVEFEIRADRFLRGMVRLIVGALVLLGRGQISPDDIRHALDKQEYLPKSYSAPAQGLLFEGVGYPENLNSESE